MKVVPKKNSKIVSLIINHVKDNLKAYVIVCSILLIGITLGVLFVNNMNEIQKQDVEKYLTEFTNSLKNGANIDKGKMLKKSASNNVILTLLMWFVGMSVVGIPVVFAIIAFRGFCLGYTISASTAVWGTQKGIMFLVTSILLQNIIFIPCMLALAVSGIKLYKSIMKDKRKENIKIEIFRHTMFSLFILIILIMSSFIETYISTNLLTMYIQHL